MSDQSGEHAHWVNDGRGRRLIFIDGERISWVLYADTKAGIAVVCDDPPTCLDGEHIDFHPVWGEITVVPVEGA
ncbi:hypothetical protein SAMN04490185_3207 [Pseudomonas frederiksbergensis]|uniref:Uncharacterized protein n=1 Tax=Pseudomonas frederiksbergensis TaxID=104087 RepID=A0A1H4ZIH9_9PSED|nr:hypothetical protein [Pseudomonas frederiksbergensis]SED29903.1 hypothetical protein SAMN04490185_3207 [Pseudomonas frederiksbergensis]